MFYIIASHLSVIEHHCLYITVASVYEMHTVNTDVRGRDISSPQYWTMSSVKLWKLLIKWNQAC